MILGKEKRNVSNINNRKITLLIIFAAMGSIITGATLLASHDLAEVAAQQEGNNNTKLSPATLRQQGVPLLGSPQLLSL